MTPHDTPTVEAAGGVLWRAGTGSTDGRVEAAVVHRPRYDDWSLPKGKLNPGEHPVLAALREVAEETGYAARPGRFLHETRYVSDGVPKRVRYWALECLSGEFAPNREVDRLVWLPVPEAGTRLAADHDRPVLTAFAADTATTWPLILVRHASAGRRRDWHGPDADRPLDGRGRAQAAALAPLLAAYGVAYVLSPDVRRCRETVEPFATAAGSTVADAPWASERGHAADPDNSRRCLLDLLAAGTPAVVATQGGVVDDLVTAACEASGLPAPDDPSLRKSGMWVLQAARADGGTRLSGVERFDPPPLPA